MPVHASQTMMRATLPVALLLSTVLAACATDKDVITAKDIPQSGTLKVHPGLIKSPPAPAEQKPAAARAGTRTGQPAPGDPARQPPVAGCNQGIRHHSSNDCTPGAGAE